MFVTRKKLDKEVRRAFALGVAEGGFLSAVSVEQFILAGEISREQSKLVEDIVAHLRRSADRAKRAVPPGDCHLTDTI